MKNSILCFYILVLSAVVAPLPQPNEQHHVNNTVVNNEDETPQRDTNIRTTPETDPKHINSHNVDEAGLYKNQNSYPRQYAPIDHYRRKYHHNVHGLNQRRAHHVLSHHAHRPLKPVIIPQTYHRNENLYQDSEEDPVLYSGHLDREPREKTTPLVYSDHHHPIYPQINEHPYHGHPPLPLHHPQINEYPPYPIHNRHVPRQSVLPIYLFSAPGGSQIRNYFQRILHKVPQRMNIKKKPKIIIEYLNGTVEYVDIPDLIEYAPGVILNENGEKIIEVKDEEENIPLTEGVSVVDPSYIIKQQYIDQRLPSDRSPLITTRTQYRQSKLKPEQSNIEEYIDDPNNNDSNPDSSRDTIGTPKVALVVGEIPPDEYANLKDDPVVDPAENSYYYIKQKGYVPSDRGQIIRYRNQYLYDPTKARPKNDNTEDPTDETYINENDPDSSTESNEPLRETIVVEDTSQDAPVTRDAYSDSNNENDPEYFYKTHYRKSYPNRGQYISYPIRYHRNPTNIKREDSEAKEPVNNSYENDNIPGSSIDSNEPSRDTSIVRDSQQDKYPNSEKNTLGDTSYIKKQRNHEDCTPTPNRDQFVTSQNENPTEFQPENDNPEQPIDASYINDNYPNTDVGSSEPAKVTSIVKDTELNDSPNDDISPVKDSYYIIKRKKYVKRKPVSKDESISDSPSRGDEQDNITPKDNTENESIQDEKQKPASDKEQFVTSYSDKPENENIAKPIEDSSNGNNYSESDSDATKPSTVSLNVRDNTQDTSTTGDDNSYPKNDSEHTDVIKERRHVDSEPPSNKGQIVTSKNQNNNNVEPDNDDTENPKNTTTGTSTVKDIKQDIKPSTVSSNVRDITQDTSTTGDDNSYPKNDSEHTDVIKERRYEVSKPPSNKGQIVTSQNQNNNQNQNNEPDNDDTENPKKTTTGTSTVEDIKQDNTPTIAGSPNPENNSTDFDDKDSDIDSSKTSTVRDTKQEINNKYNPENDNEYSFYNKNQVGDDLSDANPTLIKYDNNYNEKAVDVSIDNDSHPGSQGDIKEGIKEIEPATTTTKNDYSKPDPEYNINQDHNKGPKTLSETPIVDASNDDDNPDSGVDTEVTSTKQDDDHPNLENDSVVNEKQKPDDGQVITPQDKDSPTYVKHEIDNREKPIEDLNNNDNYSESTNVSDEPSIDRRTTKYSSTPRDDNPENYAVKDSDYNNKHKHSDTPQNEYYHTSTHVKYDENEPINDSDNNDSKKTPTVTATVEDTKQDLSPENDSEYYLGSGADYKETTTVTSTVKGTKEDSATTKDNQPNSDDIDPIKANTPEIHDSVKDVNKKHVPTETKTSTSSKGEKPEIHQFNDATKTVDVENANTVSEEHPEKGHDDSDKSSSDTKSERSSTTSTYDDNNNDSTTTEHSVNRNNIDSKVDKDTKRKAGYENIKDNNSDLNKDYDKVETTTIQTTEDDAPNNAFEEDIDSNDDQGSLEDQDDVKAVQKDFPNDSNTSDSENDILVDSSKEASSDEFEDDNDVQEETEQDNNSTEENDQGEDEVEENDENGRDQDKMKYNSRKNNESNIQIASNEDSTSTKDDTDTTNSKSTAGKHVQRNRRQSSTKGYQTSSIHDDDSNDVTDKHDQVNRDDEYLTEESNTYNEIGCNKEENNKKHCEKHDSSAEIAPLVSFHPDTDFYKKLIEEYNRLHFFRMNSSASVIHRDTKSLVYENGTVVDYLSETYWEKENDDKPLKIRTSHVIRLPLKKEEKDC